MKKLLLALALITISSAANAITVNFVNHQRTTNNGYTWVLITDGSHINPFPSPYPASTATWNWDGGTLTSSGLYSVVFNIGEILDYPVLYNDQVTDLSIDTVTSTASAVAYTCLEGDYGQSVGTSFCGSYSFGSNNIDESTTVYSGTSVSQAIGGDDTAWTQPPNDAFFYIGPRTLERFNYGLQSWNGTTLILSNGIPLGTPGGETMMFSTVPVPTAAWLFGSALGLLGWMRRKR